MSADPYLRPTLTALQAQAIQDIQAADIPGIDSLLDPATLPILAFVMAGFAWLHYDYLDFIYQQSNPWSAQGAAALGWGALKGVTPKPAVAAGTDGLGTAQFPAVLPDTPLPAGTSVQRRDGFTYTTLALAYSDGSGFVTAALLASAAGAAGNAAAGTQLTINNPVSGIGSSGVVLAPIVDGVDPETIDAFKARYLAQYQAPAHGGDAADYVNWALAIPGVTRAWVLPTGAGPGTVVVYTMFDQAEAGNGGFPVGSNGVATNESRAAPATGDLLTVANGLYLARPVTALVYSCAPIRTPVNFVIQNVSPLTSAVQTGITAALTDMFLLLGQVGGALNPATGLPFPGIYPSDWNEAVDGVPGLLHCTIVSPAAPITPTTGQLFVLGTIAFSA